MRLRLHRDCDRILIQQSFNLLTLIKRHCIRAFIRLLFFYATWTAFLSCWYTNRSPSSQLAILTVATRWPAIILSGITGGQLLVTYMRWKSSSALSSSETCLRVFLRRPSQKDSFGFLSLAWYCLLACEGSPIGLDISHLYLVRKRRSSVVPCTLP